MESSTLVIPNENNINEIIRSVFNVVRPHIKTSMKFVLASFVLFNLSTALITHHQQEIIPVQLEPRTVSSSTSPIPHSLELVALHRTKAALFMLGCDATKLETYTTACYLGSKVAGVDPVLIACIMWSESRFVLTAVSKMHYRGVMQTPTSTGRVEVDTMHGCSILRDHLADTKQNLIKALTNYKGSKRMILADGHTKSKGYTQALEVMEVYKTTKRSLSYVR